MQFWETGWQTLFDNIEPLTQENFAQTITIRGEPHSVVEAINRQLTHYSYHIGQIVLLAKHFKSNQLENAERAEKQIHRVQSVPCGKAGVERINH
jgi:hypothetical protein